MITYEFKRFFELLGLVLSLCVIIVIAMIFFLPTLGHSWKITGFCDKLVEMAKVE